MKYFCMESDLGWFMGRVNPSTLYPECLSYDGSNCLWNACNNVSGYMDRYPSGPIKPFVTSTPCTSFTTLDSTWPVRLCYNTRGLGNGDVRLDMPVLWGEGEDLYLSG